MRAVVTRRRVDDDLDEELADYLARAVERRKAAGVPPEEATRLARAEIGSAAAIKDRVQDVSRAAALMTTWQDIRYGVRLMNRSRGFTLVAALVLSLGIGTTTALFSIINALLFTPLTVPEPDELVSVYTQFPDGQFGSVLKHEFEAFVESGAQLAVFHQPKFWPDGDRGRRRRSESHGRVHRRRLFFRSPSGNGRGSTSGTTGCPARGRTRDRHQL